MFVESIVQDVSKAPSLDSPIYGVFDIELCR